MCTVVVRLEPGASLRILALRDEDTSRDFDEPGRWWPTQPSVVGGRDRTAGGSWCVTDVDTGVTALVLNRPQRRLAAPGAPSRGLLPLLAVAHRDQWPARISVDGMAAFALLLLGGEAADLWEYDGKTLVRTAVLPGTSMVTSGGPEDERATRHLDAFRAGDFPDGWRDLVTAREPADDRAALVVRHVTPAGTYGTVFGQLITSTPGTLELSCSRQPWVGGSWADRVWRTQAQVQSRAQAQDTPQPPRSGERMDPWQR